MVLVFSFPDFIIVAMCILFGYLGYRMGFYDSLLALIGFHFAAGLSLLLMRYTVGFFSFVLELSPDMSLLLGMSFLFGLFTLLWVFISQWIHSLVKMQVVEWFNRGAGILLGGYRGFLIVSLMALSFSILPWTYGVTYTETNSVLYQRIRCFLPMKYNYDIGSNVVYVSAVNVHTRRSETARCVALPVVELKMDLIKIYPPFKIVFMGTDKAVEVNQ